MLNPIIRFALQHRLVIIATALFIIVYGTLVTRQLPIDVLPDLTRPRVVLLTEAPGLAPEEVETLVTFPLEATLSGASGVEAVRSSSDIGLSLIYVEFGWGADIYVSRQIVSERIAGVLDQLPEGVRPQMAPISSLLGQIMLVGMWSEPSGQDSRPEGNVESPESSDPGDANSLLSTPGVQRPAATDPLEIRTLADWVVRKRLLTIPGVSQVITMGGGRKQYQVLIDPHLLHKYEVSIRDVEQALREGNLNVTGGYLDRSGEELLVRGLGRVESIEQIEQIVVRPPASRGGRAVLVEDVARVQIGPQVKRGDSSINGRPAVVLTIQKQPSADTRQLTEQINVALDELREALPPDVRLETTYAQREFIDHSVRNVVEAVRDGAILVVIVLFLFLFNFRTTFITLTAIPLSILVTALVFRWFGLSINVMTLGGISVAIGELVDDAVVDVENIFRRLKENFRSPDPRPILDVVFDSSFEVRGAIILSTILVALVFAPLFALSGIEGRLFTPLAIAYLVSVGASTVVSLTVTPVLSSLLLPRARATRSERDGPLLRVLKRLATPLIRFSMTRFGLTSMLLLLVAAIAVSGAVVSRLGKDFLPPFDEGATQVNLILRPGTNLETSRQVSRMADERLMRLVQSAENPHGPIRWFTARLGRAENDEHVMGVNISEYVISLNPDSGRSREELIRLLYDSLDDIPGAEIEVEQPIAHLISHMLTGVTAQIAIKLYGDDLNVLRGKAEEIHDIVARVPGVADPVVEPQTLIPQLRIELKRDQLARYGVSAYEVNGLIETAMHGRVVSTVLEGQRAFDLMIRFDEPHRADLLTMDRLPIELPDGTLLPLSELADVYEGAGVNTISREDNRRRIVVRVNTLGRDLGSTVAEIQHRLRQELSLPEGYFVVYGGQFEAQRAATARLLWLSGLAIAGVFVVLYTRFPSTSLVLQILVALPAAFVGGVAAIVISGQTFSVASMVGFISLGGIAARNGILLIGTYLNQIPEEGFTRETILRGSLNRLAPVMMTALTSGIGLLPLIIGGHLPGKEILYPVATVVVGGLVTSTMAEFLIRPGLFWHFTPAAHQGRDETSFESGRSTRSGLD
jgi:CzcA family heavy metal efflux pump